ncbi:hypothetical protein ABID22_002239 [Pontibacter aydingkolensis]|uniref:DUF1572 domain-containing protein n=1 Tax=Pontibacter aydingkolensis TaxID=1911536 RepID=A0ABS7CVI0_9BACT|nr:DUF1572 family protein [Pontibacter aydingkolensis]MBW7467845.1 DUF1572 domain-containing protein [Pontibacter aydingkolensis]
MENTYLNSVKKQLSSYKTVGEKTLDQLTDEQLFWQPNEESNSIATIVAHMHGNMLSRWTNFLTSDGEKEWRNRDAEFENNRSTREELLVKWSEGWRCLFDTLDALTEADLEKEVLIRNERHTVTDAINRQLAHYPYHIGQMAYIGKMMRSTDWTSLSIPKGKSNEYNAVKFSEAEQGDQLKKKHN